MININQNTIKLSKKLKKKHLEGFAIAGIASIPGSNRLKLRNNALDRWLSRNYHGEMKWMEAEKRKDIETLLKDARSVLSVGFNYNSTENKNNKLFKVGKFGQGEDYHKIIKKKLNNIGQWINEEVRSASGKFVWILPLCWRKLGLKNLE